MDFDAIVIGAGPAGTLAAKELARAGRSVGLFDASERERLSLPIIIEAERSVFAAVGTRPPQGDEIPYHASIIRVFSPRGREAFVVRGHDAVALRMDQFCRRLTDEAEAAGAKFFGGLRALEPIVRGEAVRGAVFEHNGAREEVTARVTIDATGNTARLARRLAALGIDFVEEPTDRVTAANFFHTIDPAAAAEAVKHGSAADGEIWNRLGMHGNYSTVYSFLDLKAGRAYILIGHRADYPNPPMAELIEGFRAEAGYYRDRLFGGGGMIRVRRSLDRMVTDGFMAVGEAASTVIPMHGSGVASAMLTGWKAGQVAAEAVGFGRADTLSLWPYAAWYQRGRGSILAGQDASRRIVGSLSRDHLRAMVEDGGMQMEDLANALAPRSPTISAETVPARLKSVLKNPGLAGPLGRTAWSVKTAERHYQKYPKEWNEEDFDIWRTGAEKIFRGR